MSFLGGKKYTSNILAKCFCFHPVIIIKTHFSFIYIYTRFFRIGESSAVIEIKCFYIKIAKYMIFRDQQFYFIVYNINSLPIYTCDT